MKKFKINAYGKTDIGTVRTSNEDAFASLEEDQFYVLADGMGGHLAGEVASNEAVDFMCRGMHQITQNNFAASGSPHLENQLKDLIISTNTWVKHLSGTSNIYMGMGTTLCCALFHKKVLYYAHVGDSRIYRLRNNTFTLLTKDHSDIRQTKRGSKKLLTQAVGTQVRVEPDVNSLGIQANDIYLLCSDGLTDFVPTEIVLSILNSSKSVEEKVSNLIDSAKTYGGSDNITAFLLEIEKVHATNIFR